MFSNQSNPMNVSLLLLQNRFLIQLIGRRAMRIQLFSTTTNYGHSMGLTVSNNLQRLQNRTREASIIQESI